MPLSTKKQPAKKPSSSGSHGGASFQRYQESTSDAWDNGDDDLLVRLKLDSNMIQSAASQVISSHSESNQTPGHPTPSNKTAVAGHKTQSTPAVNREGEAVLKVIICHLIFMLHNPCSHRKINL